MVEGGFEALKYSITIFLSKEVYLNFRQHPLVGRNIWNKSELKKRTEHFFPQTEVLSVGGCVSSTQILPRLVFFKLLSYSRSYHLFEVLQRNPFLAIFIYWHLEAFQGCCNKKEWPKRKERGKTQLKKLEVVGPEMQHNRFEIMTLTAEICL